jgi:hypothetical protein
MNCPDITTLEEAEAKLPSSVLPISGLRRKDDGTLTDDSQNTIIDGLKSRGYDLKDMETVKKITNELIILLCKTFKQYQYLMNQKLTDERVKLLIDKNLMMIDMLTITRHIAKHHVGDKIPDLDSEVNTFMDPMFKTLHDHRGKFEIIHRSKSTVPSDKVEGFSDEVQRYMVDVSKEKNRVASNYLGIYGFLNLFAVGLLIYVAASK